MKPQDRDYLVREVISLGGMLLGLYLVKRMHNGDGRTLRMVVARGVKRFAQKQADSWQTVADIAATSYNKARL